MKISVTQNQPGALPLMLPRKTKAFCLLFLMSILLTLTAIGQNNIVVKGRVTNEKKQPVVGASVLVKGTNNGTVTDDAGDYTISAPANAVLVISSVGYPSKEIPVSNQATHNLSLTTSSSDLEQVVVVGYGTQRRKDVTGSVVSVTEQALREVPTANLQGALQGKAAGLEIQNTGVVPGAGMQIRVRGTRSISGSNAPLIILDGIPYDGNLNDINPDDVASVDVLKDASATAIYGSRGANGVILVSTKKGRSGPARVSYSGYYGAGNVAWDYPVFNAEEYQAMRAQSTWAQGYMPLEQKGLAMGTNTNWQDEMYETAYKTDHNLTVSGGNDGSSYSLGGGYYKETAVLPGIDYKRYSLRATIDTRVGKRIRIGLNTMNSVGVSQGNQFIQYGYMFPLISLSPLSPTDTNGVMVLSPAGNPTDVQIYNPKLAQNNNNNWVDKVTRSRTFNSLYAEYQFIPGLKYRFNFGVSYTREEGNQFRGADTKTNPQFFNAGRGNTATVTNVEAWDYTAENVISYDKTFATKHKFNFTGLYSFQESQQHNSSMTKDSIDQDFVLFYNLGQANATRPPVVSGGETSRALISYMGRINYAFDNKYLFTLTYRSDGSSILPEGQKWHSYPAVSAGWNISNEKFAEGLLSKAKINNLKLRVGFGQTSNQSITPYTSLGRVSNGNGQTGTAGVIRYNFGPSVFTGYNLSTLPNPNLDWEYTKTLNVGLDFGILDNRITGSIEYYRQRTHNILYNVRIPATSGISSNQFFTNVGEMENHGMEFTVSSINIRSRNSFTWTTDLNLFFNRNELTALSSGVSRDIANQLFVGESITAIYDYKKLGIWQKEEAAAAAAFNSVPGQLKLEDRSGPNGKPDGLIDANDRYVIGNADAKLQGGMTNRFAYKNLDLSVVMYARFGGLLVSQVHQPTGTYVTQMNGDRNQIKVDYWTANNPTNWFPNPSNTLSPVTNAFTSLSYYDATFVKIRSINLGYTFGKSVLQKAGAQNIRLYATIDNVATLFSPYLKKTGIDPLGTGTGDQSVGGVGNIRTGQGDNNTITVGTAPPPIRTFIIGVNVYF